MCAKTPLALSLLLVLALAAAAPAAPGPLVLTIQNGRVVLFAENVPLRQILAEWERVGGTRITNKERVPASLVTLDLAGVSEEKALDILLRSAAGFAAVTRADLTGGASKYARIVIMPGAAAPAMAGTAPQPPVGASAAANQPRGQVQRRVMADGRVVSFVDNPNNPGQITVVDDDADQADAAPAPGLMRPPFQGPPGAQPGAERGQMSADPYQLGGQAGQAQQAPTVSTVPTVTGATVATPGVIAPGAKPGTPTPPGPPKPPGW